MIGGPGWYTADREYHLLPGQAEVDCNFSMIHNVVVSDGNFICSLPVISYDSYASLDNRVVGRPSCFAALADKIILYPTPNKSYLVNVIGTAAPRLPMPTGWREAYEVALATAGRERTVAEYAHSKGYVT